MRLILASQSPYRKAQLENLGIEFVAIRPLVNEEELKERGPRDLVELTRYLAFHKAESLRPEHPDAVILGSDQLAEVDGERLDKPGNHKRALEQLRRLQGRSHRLITSLSVLSQASTYTFTDITTLHLRALTDSQIENYLYQDQPYDCAGSYKFEKGGIALIDRVETVDPSAIQGLPLISLTTALLQLDFPIWRKK